MMLIFHFQENPYICVKMDFKVLEADVTCKLIFFT